MNLSAFMKSSQDKASRAAAIVCVFMLRVITGTKSAWKNRVALAPVIARYAIVFMLGMLMSVLVMRSKDAEATRNVPFTSREEILAAAAASELQPDEMSSEDDSEAKSEQIEAIQQAAIKREAQYMARVLYGTARYHSRETQEAVCWCIINRVESSLFPNSVEEVCSQSVQWVGYSSNNPVTQELFDVAMDVLNTWHDKGIRMIPQDYLYFSWSEDEIVLRTSFNETARTHYWHVTG